MLTRKSDSEVLQYALEYFQKYILIATPSDIFNPECPSNPAMFDLAKVIQQDLKELGLDSEIDKNCYLYATLPGNTEARYSVGFLAHLDTISDVPSEHIKARRVTYEGQDIILNEERTAYQKGEEEAVIMSEKLFPSLAFDNGQDIIVTDGSTILATDDKAGVANIMAMIKYFTNHPEVKHGDIQIGFTPDEEIGRGAALFDVKRFGADYAYTLDACAMGEYSWENFNAASADVYVEGLSVHTGTAKGKMINSQYLAAKFIERMPLEETPEKTEGREGFYHLSLTEGRVEETVLRYIIRDFSKEGFAQRKHFIENLAAELNKEQGQKLFRVEIKDTYYNMQEKIEPHKFIVDYLTASMRELGIKPVEIPFRGGTDGSGISHKGLPCPNIFTGGINFHSRHEYLSLQSMEKSIWTLINLAQKFI